MILARGFGLSFEARNNLHFFPRVVLKGGGDFLKIFHMPLNNSSMYIFYVNYSKINIKLDYFYKLYGFGSHVSDNIFILNSLFMAYWTKLQGKIKQ